MTRATALPLPLRCDPRAWLLFLIPLLLGLPHAARAGEEAEPAATSGTPALDLPGAIALALENNPGLRAYEADRDAAEAERSVARAGLLPSLDLSAGVTGYRQLQRLYPPAAPGEPAVTSHDLVSGDLVLSAPLYASGRLRAELRAAEAGAASAEDSLVWSRSELIFAVTVVWYDIHAQRALLSAIHAAEDALGAHRVALVALLGQEKAAQVDIDRLDVRIAALRHHGLTEETTLAHQRYSLSALLGLDPGGPKIMIAGDLDGALPEAPSDGPALVGAALARRADLQALRDDLRAQQQRTRATRAQRGPALAVAGSYGVRYAPWPYEQPEGTDSHADVGQVGLALDLPLFNGGAQSAAVQAERAREEAMAARLREAELRVAREVESARVDLAVSVEAIGLQESIGHKATEALRVETERQVWGLSTISDVLSAQADLLEAQATWARSLADAHVAGARLRLLTGEIE